MEAVTPIIYKRRERLLDEELDDTKDIITSNATNISTTEIVATHQKDDPGVGYKTDGGNKKLADAIGKHADPLKNNTSTQGQCKENDLQCGIIENEMDPNSCVVTSNSPYETDGRLSGEGEGREIFAAGNETGATATLIDLTEVPTTSNDLTATPGDHPDRAPDEKVMEKRNSPTSKSNVTPKICALDMALAQTVLEAAATGATQMRIDPVRTVSSAQQMHKPKHTSHYHSLQNESSSKASHNSKSCTQSSSISDAIDFQESIILRRQQLNRVAEWVQNNTQQLEQQQQQQQQQRIQQQQQALNSVNNCDSSGGTDRQSSFSTLDPLDSVSMEKLSMDSGYKTTPQPHTNGFHQPSDDANKSTEDSLSPKTDTNSSLNNNNYKNTALINRYQSGSFSQELSTQVYPTNTYFRRTTRSGLPVAYTTPDPNAFTAETFLNNYNNNNNNSTCSTTPTLPDQPTCDILNYKYYPSDTDKTHAISAELHTTTKHVDIAQMEYNVKQFLLKQNEWSMRASTIRGGRAGINTSASNLSSANSQVTLSSQRTQTTAKTLRHLKLFSGIGVGPGVGARVQSPLVKDAVAGSMSSHEERELKVKAASSNGFEGAKMTTAVSANALPQRTETNL